MTLMQFLYKVRRRIEVYGLYIAGKTRAPFSESHYHIRKGYRHRTKEVYFDDTSLKDEYQREVYEIARLYLDKHKYKQVLDIGCGSAYKLLQYFQDCDTTGIEVTRTYTFLKAKYPDRIWVDAADKQNYPTHVDIIICADVIEHVANPDELLQTISQMQFALLFLSTPERDLARGGYDFGPPDNTAHIREWSAKEFKTYISGYFEIMAHMITNVEDATQMLICRKKS